MHTARQLTTDLFTAMTCGTVCPLQDVSPRWLPHERLGVVTTEALGALGASLLIQAQIAQFYSAWPGRRDAAPQYPEVYLFHLRGRHGDYTSFDFWPPRKDVQVSAGADLLGVLNDYAITRLALPDGFSRPCSDARYWADLASFSERFVAGWTYSPDGRSVNADVSLSGPAEILERNVQATMTIPERMALVQGLTAEQLLSFLPGPVTASEAVRAPKEASARQYEISPKEIRDASASRNRLVINGTSTETYRKMSLNSALERMGIRPRNEIPQINS